MNEWFWEKETVYERARDGKREREREVGNGCVEERGRKQQA